MASKHFAFTSNKLEYLSDKLNKKYRKIKNSGFTLWTRCMDGDLSAWEEMEEYNKHDVLALEELYVKLRTWEPTVNYSVYKNEAPECVCGSKKFLSKGYAYTSVGKYKRLKCSKCGKNYQDRTNLLTKEHKKHLLK